MKKILVIDAQGGGIGKQIINEIIKKNIKADLLAVGTNSAATALMLKAGARHAATGENPVIVACRKADFIIGPIGIVIADAMYGEITPAMAVTIGQSQARKVLIPVTSCGNYVVGTADANMKDHIQEAVSLVADLINQE